ncbi:MAG: hypothetical protein IIW92_03365 [Lachnospiraceae bacterium]|nr:hypothetical protein [Lachnospiraceae bacterium]
MIKFKVLILLSLCILQLDVLAKHYEVSQLPIVVRNITEWSAEYPTVINNWKGMFVQSVKGDLPEVLSVVVALNGKDTKGMSEEAFNELLMSTTNSRIEYMIKQDGENIKKECTIHYHNNIYWADGISMGDPDAFPENISMKNIKNASVFSFNTFAYKSGDVADLDEQAVLDAAGKSLAKLGFKKADVTNNADMVLILQKGRDNYNGHKITLKVLDAKRLQDGVERTLWSLDITDLGGDITKSERDIKTALYTYCSNFPFDIPTYSQNIYTIGVAFESQHAVSTGKTLMILQNSDAYDKGLRSGDAIIGAYAGTSWQQLYYTKTRRYYFKPNKKSRKKNWGVDLLFFMPIIPQFTYNNSETYLTDNTWRGGDNSKNHFRVRNRYGEKIVVPAPFEKRKFNFKYIK